MSSATSSPKPRRAWKALVANLREAYRDGIDKLEWMGPETKKQAQEKLAKFTPKIGYPNKWRDYSKLEIKKDDLVGNMMRAFEHENTLPARQGRQADRSRAVGHDAADHQRVLQPGPQRDRLPRRHPAAAVLQSRGGRCGELRRHRRGDRPRDGPRLRRPGPPLRRHRRAARLVDEDRTKPNIRSAPRCWSSSSTSSSRCPGCTSTAR